MYKTATCVLALALSFISVTRAEAKIDRKAVVRRNDPHITEIDTLASLSVGNGGFAFTADVTGLQTFPETYSKGVPLGTQSQWGWHSFPNPEGYRLEEVLQDGYARQYSGDGRAARAANWLRANPHRLHLGYLGFYDMDIDKVSRIDQRLNLWRGSLESSFNYDGSPVSVRTSCNPIADQVIAIIHSPALVPVSLCFPYPTGQHSDDASAWDADDKHSTEIIATAQNRAIVRRTLDETVYYVKICWKHAEAPVLNGRNSLILRPTAAHWKISISFSPDEPDQSAGKFSRSVQAGSRFWRRYWRKGGIVDFGHCQDARAPELERRVILSQYLTAIQCAGTTPPQETGLTYNSWFGKFHLEMTWWHQAHFALWNHDEMLARTLLWYETVSDIARGIARRQGYAGLRWMKMTDPSGQEAPSNVGSYLLWQQPHFIYLAELLYRSRPSLELLERYESLVGETAEFLASFLKYDAEADRYVLSGLIPAQETLSASTTVNPPFELAYCRWALSVAQEWRERLGQERKAGWDEIIAKMSNLASKDGLYLAAESNPDTYENIRLTSDHMAVLASFGVLPDSPLFDKDTMLNTLDWVCVNWNWDRTWGWDFPVTAMNATRLGQPEKAIDAILMNQRTNTYLPNGHNYQDSRLRCYLPGNGGLLTTVALMCAGWDGCTVKNPGFPEDGTWDVRWKGLKPMP
jgi:hypothetical protein